MASPGSLHRADVEDVFTLTPLQQGMLGYAASGLHAFHERTVTALDGPLNLEAFSAAWHAVVRRHGSLRTAFVWRNVRVPHQIVFRQAAVRMRRVDWSGLDAEAQERQLKRLLAAPADWTLDRPPLMTLFLVRTGERRHHLVWTISHLVTDAFSFSIVIEDLMQRYRLALEGRPWDPRPAPSFREYVGWLKRQDPAPALAAWERELGSRPGPQPGPRQPSLPAPGAPPRVTTRTMTLAGDLTAALQSVCRRRRTSLFVVYLGTLALVQRVLTGCSRPAIAIVTSGRSLPVNGLDSIVGLVMNSVPVPIDVPEQETLAGWLAALGDPVQRFLRFEHVPFQRLQEMCSVHGRRVDVALNFLNVNRRPPRGPGFDVTEYRQALSSSFPVGVNVIPGGETQIEVSFAPSVYRAAAVERMLEQWREVLALVPAGERRVGDVARGVTSAAAAARAVEVERRRRASLPEWML